MVLAIYLASTTTEPVRYIMQYSYTFSAYNGNKYTLVAANYAQAKRYFSRVFSKFLTVTYNGRYLDKPVKNGTVVKISGFWQGA